MVDLDLMNFINQIKKEKYITLNNLKIQMLVGILFSVFSAVLLSDSNTHNIIIFGITFIVFFTSIILNVITILKMIFFKNKYKLLLDFYNIVLYVKKENKYTIEEKINVISEAGLAFNEKSDFYKLRPIYMQDVFSLLNVKTYTNQNGNYENNKKENNESTKRKDEVIEALEFIYKTRNITKEMKDIKNITKQYKERAKILHPDKPTGSKEEFQILNNYFQILKNKFN